MLGQESPLQTIHHKEAEVRRRLEAARQQADIRLQAARQEAQQLLVQAEQDGQLKAQALYEQELSQTHREATTLLTNAQTQADAVQRQATAHLNDAVEQVLRLVLPKNFPPPQPSQS
jgi:vacuolar-type H+-ATPase subunit H